MTAQLIAISVGQCQPLQASEEAEGTSTREVLSAIRKAPISTLASPQAVLCGELGLEGDEQADHAVHGGRDKALCCYPTEHYAYWQDHLEPGATGRSRFEQYGALGENLTIEGLTEQEVFVGDLWQIGEVRLEVTQPRKPCFKFNAITGDRLAGKKMLAQGASGWYLKVLNPGTIRAGDPILIEPGPRQQSIEQVLRLL